MADYDLEDDFPNLKENPWQQTSDPATNYNCIAWSLYDTRQWWQKFPFPLRGYYWPPGISRDDTLDSWIKVFEIHGYRLCEGTDLELGFEKVAIYVKDNEPQHVARQLPSGSWTSKLGKDEDIEHSPHGLEGNVYGTIEKVLKRERQ
ncbi:MAG: hypothetical protein AABO57_26965 [Acidobacteriota bacterium]